MFTNSWTRVVEWGDCDPAGIVFYPRFFAIFDTSTSRLLEAATGQRKSDIIKTNGIIGWPKVETGARFLAPATYGDEVRIDTEITRVVKSSFALRHRLSRDDLLCVECTEVRVWTGHSADGDGKISAMPIPEEIVSSLAAA